MTHQFVALKKGAMYQSTLFAGDGIECVSDGEDATIAIAGLDEAVAGQVLTSTGCGGMEWVTPGANTLQDAMDNGNPLPISMDPPTIEEVARMLDDNKFQIDSGEPDAFMVQQQNNKTAFAVTPDGRTVIYGDLELRGALTYPRINLDDWAQQRNPCKRVERAAVGSYSD